MRFQLALFDFDGTLADTYPLFAESLDTLAIAHRFRRLPADQISSLRGLSATEVLAALDIPLWKVPAIAAHFRTLMQQRIAEIQPFPGVFDALHTLADQGVQLALVTSNSLHNVQHLLGAALAGRFSQLECGTSLFGKARRLHRLVKHTGVAPSAVIYIGDEVRDADAARKAGIAFGAVAWGYTEAATLQRHNPQILFTAPAQWAQLA